MINWIKKLFKNPQRGELWTRVGSGQKVYIKSVYKNEVYYVDAEHITSDEYVLPLKRFKEVYKC